MCRYKPSPAEVAASCDVTFAMLADPESAVSMSYYLDFSNNIRPWWIIVVTFTIRWLLLVEKMGPQVEWVQEKGIYSSWSGIKLFDYRLFRWVWKNLQGKIFFHYIKSSLMGWVDQPNFFCSCFWFIWLQKLPC